MVSLGFVVARFSVWLRELSVQLRPGMQIQSNRASMPFGLAMTALGAILAPLAAWRYHIVNRRIEEGDVTPDRGLIVLITAMVALLAVGMIAYLIFNYWVG